MMNNQILGPDYGEIKNLEKIANKDGSGIKFDELIGNWKFQYVWKQGAESIDNISSSLLQVLVASLELSNIQLENDPAKFEIKNSLKFGVLSIAFCGEAFLKGTRPLLYFSFKNLNIKVGNITVLNKSLKKTEFKKMPFFSLIAIDKKEEWLCARGKGGGLALWKRN